LASGRAEGGGSRARFWSTTASGIAVNTEENVPTINPSSNATATALSESTSPGGPLRPRQRPWAYSSTARIEHQQVGTDRNAERHRELGEAGKVNVAPITIIVTYEVRRK
jgi:hypothetical protein